MAAQQPDGWFGHEEMRTSLKGKPDMWPHMLVLNAMQSYYEFSGDKRVLDFMTRYFRWQNAPSPVPGVPTGGNLKNHWAGDVAKVRRGDNLESVYWLYNRTGEAWLLDLAKKLHQSAADWTTGIYSWHCVDIAQGFREPADYWVQTNDRKFLDAAERNYGVVMGAYGQFPGGGFAGDERCRPGYFDPRQGFETCAFVEFMRSVEILTRITGDPLWADRCEEIAFNSLPAAMTPDLKAIHYLTCANVVQLDRKDKSPDFRNDGDMLSFSPGERYRCCQHNHGMGWPYYAEELWLATADNGLCASLYAASEITARVGTGAKVRIIEETDYPFGETVSLKIATRRPVRFPLYLRVPRWSGQATVSVNDKDIAVEAKPISYLVVDRTWQDGDRLTLRLPMRPSVRKWAKNMDSVSIDYGALTFSLKIGEKWVRYGGSDAWPEWEVLPTSAWNYGLVIDSGEAAKSLQVVRKSGPVAPQPFTPDSAPIELRVKARRIPAWQLNPRGMVGMLQPSPVRSEEPEETIVLIPMGAARLRISSFPTIGTGAFAHDWEPSK